MLEVLGSIPSQVTLFALPSFNMPVRLADKSIIYSEGKGEVHFKPTRFPNAVVSVSDVLYVPNLNCNLFAPLHLTQHRGFEVIITKGSMEFKRNGGILLTGTVSDDNVAKLKSHLAHISRDRVDQLLREKLVVNLKLSSDMPMDDICTPCIMGKQHRDLFPKEATDRNLKLQTL
ncbi:hypothetical protein K474DRAFT_1716925 [Panus rudis PR-1116 ss-1]|nr:hypothetical protein K474DRAFT_1716925 [Panus rudis PR-1116 ss-1]